MTGEWTFSTLMQWIEAKLDTVHAILDERAKAITVAFASFEKRMDSTNEWRAALDDQTKTLASRMEVADLKQRIEKLETALASTGGMAAGAQKNTTMIFAIIAAIGTLIGIIGIATRFLN